MAENVSFSNRILWLLKDEFGYPSELVSGSIGKYPIVIVSDEVFIKNPIIGRCISQGTNLIMGCSREGAGEFANFGHLKDVLPIIFDAFHSQVGHYMISDKRHFLSSFFPQRRLNPETRKDFNITLDFRRVQVYSPAETVVKFETSSGDQYPVLICGKNEEGGRFAIITPDSGVLQCHYSNWGPLLYLAGLEWCLANKPFVRKWHWPNGKRMAATLTFDFETLALYSNQKKAWWWHRSFDRFLLGLGFRPIITFLKKNKLHSTWFILGSQAIHTPNLANKLASNELVEVAGHGDVHMGIDDSAKRFDEDSLPDQKNRLTRMKRTIKSVISISVKGFRAPGLYANHDTLVALQEGGFLWDCSASPQTNYSTRWFFLPYRPLLDWERKKELEIVEIPVVEPWDQYCPAHSKPHSPEEYLQEIVEDFKLLHFIGGLQTLLVHPYWITVHQASWKAVESFVDRTLKFDDVIFLSCGAVYSNWKNRSKMEMEATFNDGASTIHVDIKNAEPSLSLLVHIPNGYQVVKALRDDATPISLGFWDDLKSAVLVVDVKGKCKYTLSLDKI